MKLYRNGTQVSQKGPPEWFTGSVRIDPLNTAPPARHGVDTHPLGQTLVVTSSVGWMQCEGETHRRNPSGRCCVVSARPSSLARRPPPTTAMTHIAIQEAQGGKMVKWMEVADQDYLVGPLATSKDTN